MGPLLVFLFFLSGSASLVYQVAWQRVLTQLIGIDSYSMTLIVSIFMIGLGFGSLYGARLARVSRNPLRMLCVMELAIGLFGYFSVDIMRSVDTLLPSSLPLVAECAVHFVLMLLPTLAMGATTPLMVHVVRTGLAPGFATGKAYAANILGAAFGVLFCGFYAVGTFGLVGSCHITAALDAVIGISFGLLSLRAGGGALSQPKNATLENAPRPASSAAASSGYRHVLVGTSFIIGFVALGYEVVFFRLFTTYFGVTPYVFPTLLFAYLVNMTFGTYVSGRLLQSGVAPAKVFAAASVLALLLTAPILWGQELMLKLGIDQLSLVFDPYITTFQQNLPLLGKALLLSVTMMAPVAALSALLPAMVQAVCRSSEETGQVFGRIYFFQTLGNAAGCILTGFVLYQFIGTIEILRVFGVALTVAALMFVAQRESGGSLRMRRLLVAAAVVCMVPAWIGGTGFYDSVRYFTATGPLSPTWIRDDAHGLSLVYPKDRDKTTYAVMAGGRFYVTGFVGSSSKFDDNKLGVVGLVHTARGDAKRVLMLGLGTASELIEFRALFPEAEIVVVEINPTVVSAIREFGHERLVNALADSRVVIMDGRRYLASAAAGGETFDYIHIGVDRATTTGAGNLFSREFLALVRDRLNAGGVATFYAYPSVVNSALSVFPDVLAFQRSSGIGQVLAFRDKIPSPVDAFVEKISTRFEEAIPVVSARTGLLYESPFKEGVSFSLTRAELETAYPSVPPLTDDHLVTEYYLNNRLEEIDSQFEDGKPRDFRGLPRLAGAKAFPRSPTAADPAPVDDRHLALDWQLGQSPLPLVLGGGKEDRTSLEPSSGRISVTYLSWFEDQIESPDGWQWSLTPPLAVGDASDRTIGFEVTGVKRGRGIWGVKVAFRTADGQWKIKRIATASEATQALRAELAVPAGAMDVGLSVFLDDSAGFGRETSVEFKRIRTFARMSSKVAAAQP